MIPDKNTWKMQVAFTSGLVVKDREKTYFSTVLGKCRPLACHVWICVPGRAAGCPSPVSPAFPGPLTMAVELMALMALMVLPGSAATLLTASQRPDALAALGPMPAFEATAPRPIGCPNPAAQALEIMSVAYV
jgi:hypothetical protein